MNNATSVHDNFIRAIMADKNLAMDYFQQYLPTFISQQLNFTTLVQLPDSYLSEELRKTMSDIVYTCDKKDKTSKIKVSLLIEHKSHPDKFTPVQIGSYIFSALQKQVTNKETLSIVIPILLYHGKEKWQYRTLSNLFNNITDEWKQFIPDFAYIYNNLGAISDEQVEVLKNKFLVASLLALKHSSQKDWLERNALRMLLLAEDAQEGLQKNFAVYLFDRSELKETTIRKVLESLSIKLKDTVMSTLDIFTEKGRKEGRNETEKKKNHEFVSNLLLQTDFTIAKIASLANVDEAFVQEVQDGLK